MPHFLEHVADVVVQAGRADEVSVNLLETFLLLVALSRMAFLSDRHVQLGSVYLFATEGAEDDVVMFRTASVFRGLRNSFPELGSQELTLALLAFFFELETDLLTVDLFLLQLLRRDALLA